MSCSINQLENRRAEPVSELDRLSAYSPFWARSASMAASMSSSARSPAAIAWPDQGAASSASAAAMTVKMHVRGIGSPFVRHAGT